MPRNFSINAYLNRRAARHTPTYRFAGATKQDWQRWREELHPRLLATLGQMPEKVPLNPEIVAEWEEDGLIKQRVLLDVEDGLSAAVLLFRPARHSGKLPGILACHGHGYGPYSGKNLVMGYGGTAEQKAILQQNNYDFGLQMAKAGYAVIAIDWRGFGERDDRCKPNHNDIFHGRDICDCHYVRATILGMTVLGMNIHDGRCALDYLCTREFVDSARIGVMGLSLGGTMATWMSLCDERIRATDIICYSDRFADFGVRDANFCGSQVTPGLYALCDVPDLQGLIAPRPLLVEIGAYDECFLVDSAMCCYREVEKIYAAAGVSDRLELDLFDGGHRWSGRKSFDFFAKHLA